MNQEANKYGDNTKTLIVQISGNYNSLGLVTNCNNEITKITGYLKSEIMGQNINRIIPKIVAEVHDIFIQSFLDDDL